MLYTARGLEQGSPGSVLLQAGMLPIELPVLVLKKFVNSQKNCKGGGWINAC